MQNKEKVMSKRSKVSMRCFHELVQQRRKEFGWTQDQAAEVLDVTDARRIRYLEGEISTLPDPEAWQRITSRLEIDRVQLLVEMGYLVDLDLHCKKG